MKLSVVVPVYNNAGSLPELSRRVKAAVADVADELELIFIDDGSVDDSAQVIRDLAADGDWVRGIELSRNFGQQAAVTAGLDLAGGDWVAIMDADLQDRPEHLPRMLEKASEGFDMVYAIGRAGADPSWRRGTARFFAALFRTLSRTQLPWRTGLYRVFNRKVLEAIRRFPERQRFMIGLLTWSGYRTYAMELERDGRAHGGSQFSLFGLLSLGSDALLSFSIVPLRVALFLGASSSLAGTIWALFLVTRRILTGIPLGLGSILCAVLVMGGINLLVLGLIGEYVGRTYVEVQARPLYLVRSYIGRRPA